VTQVRCAAQRHQHVAENDSPVYVDAHQQPNQVQPEQQNQRAADWRAAGPSLREIPTSAACFLPGGHAPAVGSIFRNPGLARSLRAIAQDGRDAFYKGLLADAIVRYSQSVGGLFTHQDFAEHTSTDVEPVSKTNWPGVRYDYVSPGLTRPDLSVFLPPIGGATCYIFGEVAALADRKHKITCRVHDECNGSDVFGSDICTCRPYLVHGVEECAREAQRGGAGLIVYNRKEGRALGEVTKFLVYNARKRQEGGDTAATYFERTECVAGVQDARFQELMPDVIHWLGITRIDRFVSMSNMKYDALTKAGIEIAERVAIPEELVPQDASVEIEAKKAAGYYAAPVAPGKKKLAETSYERGKFSSLFGNGPGATPVVSGNRIYTYGITGHLTATDFKRTGESVEGAR